MGLEKGSASAGLAQPDRQKRCLALVRIVTRKHRSGSPRAFRQANRMVRTGRAAEAGVASCEIKGFTEQEATPASAVRPAPDATFCERKNRQEGIASSTATAMWSEPAAGMAR